MSLAIFAYYLLLAVIAFGVFFYNRTYNNLTARNKELLHEKNLIELKTKAFSSQMNPHFVYNSLSAAQYLVMINENKKAFNYLSDFSLLLRQMFENAKKTYVPLTDEITFVKRYIELERLRFNNSFTYSINQEKIDESKNYYIPTMMIQPIVENAIRHGLAPKKVDAELKIDFETKDDLLMIWIDDNGIGLKKDLQSFPKYENSALKIISERLRLINETNHRNSYIKITDKKTTGMDGVLVELALPVQNN
ncbi:MAG: histidine kinase [Parafilimonas sp.]|nr:histidine kinase [Parafilimonas sp.]